MSELFQSLALLLLALNAILLTLGFFFLPRLLPVLREANQKARKLTEGEIAAAHFDAIVRAQDLNRASAAQTRPTHEQSES